ncbi:MAG: hypothetical protein IJ468_01190 [Lachnospiraceae bacterium]|nr:hypothetical protein [Lachnospiraceae bacterium]
MKTKTRNHLFLTGCALLSSACIGLAFHAAAAVSSAEFDRERDFTVEETTAEELVIVPPLPELQPHGDRGPKDNQ